MASSSRDGLNTPVLHPVWRLLCIELVEVILKHVPSESRMRFRAVCKRFNRLIMSPKFARKCQQARKPVPVIVRRSIPSDSCSMEVFNSETKSWLTHPLPILEVSLYPLELSAASGGLVCFVTRGCGKFVVCNPLTGAFRLLEFPYPIVNDICTLVRNDAAFTVLVVDLQAGTFTLVVVIIRKIEQGRKTVLFGAERKTFLYDSVDGSWRSGAPLPDRVDYNNAITSHRVDCSNAITSNGSIYVLLLNGLFSVDLFYRLLKYDVCRDSWSEISIKGFKRGFKTLEILEHRCQVVVVATERRSLPQIHLPINPPHDDFEIDHPIDGRVIQAVYRVREVIAGHGETLVKDRVMFRDLHRNVNSYQGWINARNVNAYQGWINVGSYNGEYTTIGIGDVICITRDIDKYADYSMQVLHFNCSSKKSSLLPECPPTNSDKGDRNELKLLEPSLTVDL